MYPCLECGETFTRQSNLVRHRNEAHFHVRVKHYKQTNLHTNCLPQLPLTTRNGITRMVCATAFNNHIRDIRFKANDIFFPTEFLEAARPLIQDTLDILKEEKQPMKIASSLCVEFTNGKVADESYFSVKANDLRTWDFDKVIHLLQTHIENYTVRGSHWIISKTNFFQLNVTVHCRI